MMKTFNDRAVILVSITVNARVSQLSLGIKVLKAKPVTTTNDNPKIAFSIVGKNEYHL